MSECQPYTTSKWESDHCSILPCFFEEILAQADSLARCGWKNVAVFDSLQTGTWLEKMGGFHKLCTRGWGNIRKFELDYPKMLHPFQLWAGWCRVVTLV